MQTYLGIVRKKIDVYKIFPFTICLTLSYHTFDEQLDNFKYYLKI